MPHTSLNQAGFRTALFGTTSAPCADQRFPPLLCIEALISYETSGQENYIESYIELFRRTLSIRFP
jgi:hypothetical protein